MVNTCKMCDKEFKEDATFHRHFKKAHGFLMAEYYQKYYPRHDKLTRELIEFKSKEFYFANDFNSKANLKTFLETTPKGVGLSYLQYFLRKRKEEKKITYAPGQWECKSLCFPSIQYIHRVYGPESYENLCLETGLILKHNYRGLPLFTDNDLEYIIDTREQTPLKMPKSRNCALSYGDYSVAGSEIFIERKTLNDFCGTLSSGFDRFCKEVDRCKKVGHYLVVLVEEEFNRIYLIKELSRHIKFTPDFILHRGRDLLSLYPLECQIVSVKGRKQAVDIIEKIYNSTTDVRSLDLQYFVDKGLM